MTGVIAPAETIAGRNNRLPALGLFEIRAVEDYTAEIEALTVRGIVASGRQDLPPLPFRLPLDWHADPFGDRNWMFQLHAWRFLDPYLNRLSREPGHRQTFSDVHAIIADWHRDNIRGRRGAFTWYDMATGLRALKLAYLVLAGRRHGVVPPDPPMMAELIERHVAMLADPDRLSAGNHGLFQLNGLMALVWLHPDLPRAARAKRHAVTQMTALLERQLGPEGIHTENSPYYHVFATKKIARILKAPWWKIPRSAPLRAKLARAEAAGDWLTDPGGRGVPIGDSDRRQIVATPPQLADWPHVRQNALLGAVLDGYGVVRSAPDVAPERASLLFMTASFRAHVHKHSDCLSFVWQEAGCDILVDSGKYGNERDLMRAYFCSTRAHNTVEIDTEAFEHGVGHAYGAGMRQVTPLGEAWLLEAEADRRHLGAVHRRVLLYRPERFVLAVDHITPHGAAFPDGPLRTFTSWWHFDPCVELAQGTAQGVWHAIGLSEGRRLSVVHAANAETTHDHLHLGERTPRIQGWVSRSYLKYAPAPALGFSSQAGPAYFAATLFELFDPLAAPALTLAWRPERSAISFAAGETDPAQMQPVHLGEFTLEANSALLQKS